MEKFGLKTEKDVIIGLNMVKSGHLYKCLCPYHKEKTSSFFYNKKEKRFYCFGCGKFGSLKELIDYLNE